MLLLKPTGYCCIILRWLYVKQFIVQEQLRLEPLLRLRSLTRKYVLVTEWYHLIRPLENLASNHQMIEDSFHTMD